MAKDCFEDEDDDEDEFRTTVAVNKWVLTQTSNELYN
jgi:hypothetical protein